MGDDTFALLGRIVVSGEDSLKGVNKQLDTMKSKADGAKQSAGQISAGIVAAGAAATAVGAGIAASLGDVGKVAADWGAQVLTVQRLTGLNAEESSQWANIMERYGIQGRSLGMVFKTLSTQIEATNNSTHDGSTALEQMGVKLDANGKIAGSQTDVLKQVADWYSKQTDKTLANAEASKVLGRGWMALLPVMSGGSKVINDVNAKLADTGKVLNQGQIKQAKDYGVAVADNAEAWQGFQVQMGSYVLPQMSKLAGYLTDFLKWLDGLSPETKQWAVTIAEVAAGLLLVGGPILTIIGLLPALSGGFAILTTALGIEAGAAGTAWAATLGPIALIIVAIAALAFTVYEVVTHWEIVSTFFKNLWGGIVEGAKMVWDYITQFAQGFQDGILQAVNNVIGFFWALPGEMLKMLNQLVAWIEAPIKKAVDWLSYLDPFAKHSPSLVDNVLAGTSKIADAYKGLSGMQIGAPSIGSTGGGVAGLGAQGGSYVGASNTYNLHIHSSARTEPIMADFSMLKAMSLKGN